MKMRIIKFRAWTKKWGMVLPDNGKITIDVHAATVWEDARDEEGVILMQFTGLLDKNKKEIYEGDIAKATPYSYDSIEKENIFQVAYIDDCFCLSIIYGEGKKLEYAENLSDCTLNNRIEVIGNIYQNPELLTNHK